VNPRGEASPRTWSDDRVGGQTCDGRVGDKVGGMVRYGGRGTSAGPCPPVGPDRSPQGGM